MNHYKLLSLSYPIALYIIAIYLEPYTIALSPLLILVAALYMLRSPFSIPLSATILTLDTVLLYRFNWLLSLAALPSIYPLVEASLRGGDLGEAPDRGVYHLGSTSLLILTIIASMLILSIFDVSILLAAAALAGYWLHRFLTAYLSSNKLVFLSGDRLTVFRDVPTKYTLTVRNGGGLVWRVFLSDYSCSEYVVRLGLHRFFIEPGGVEHISMELTGSKMGSYRHIILARAVDSHAFFRRLFRVGFEMVVKPKLSLVRVAARRFLEALGGMGYWEAGVEAIYAEPSRSGLFRGVRPYIPGDDVRSIHFKKSLEHLELAVREFDEAKYAPHILLIDLSVDSYESLDEVLYNSLALLLRYLMDGYQRVGLLMYNYSDVITRMSPANPIILLKRVMGLLDGLRVGGPAYSYILDEPDLKALLVSPSPISKLEYEFLVERFDSSVLSEVFRFITEASPHNAVPILVAYRSGLRNLYPVLEHYLERGGYTLRRLSLKRVVEGGITPDQQTL